MAPWESSRAEGLRRLHCFLPSAGQAYAATRNFDHGPSDRSNVSTLSPYLRHRLILEHEVVEEVLKQTSFSNAEKFLQEVCWRTYWKGWLELRPTVWTDYRLRVHQTLASMDQDSVLRDRWEQATTGKTGIDCMNVWACELLETGYLHNHARMWFASLWIFTLGLPWELGADFFYRHLLDGDPASNTLSWRWVAGLQTRGKTYLAQAENINRFTSGRFHPKEPLARVANPVAGPPLPAPRLLPPAEALPGAEYGLLITEEDLDPASLGLDLAQVQAVAGIVDSRLRSELPVGQAATHFTSAAMDDALSRASESLGRSTERLDSRSWEDSVTQWAVRQGIQQIVTAYPPQGPTCEKMAPLRAALAQEGILLSMIRRPWDNRFWPHATSGFFPFKEKIPQTLQALGIQA